jgi:hypothetical protein
VLVLRGLRRRIRVNENCIFVHSSLIAALVKTGSRSGMESNFAFGIDFNADIKSTRHRRCARPAIFTDIA